MNKLFCKKLPYDPNSEYNPEHEEKPIAQNQQKASEDYHGGDESTQSIPNSQNQSNNDHQNAKSSKSDAANNSCSSSQQNQGQGSQDSSPDNSDGLNNFQDQENDSHNGLSDSNTFDTSNSETNFENSDEYNDESDENDVDEGDEDEESGSSDSFEQADDFNSSDDQQYSCNYNTEQVVDLYSNNISKKYHATQFYRFLENFAEEKTKIFDVNSNICDEYNVKKLMFRRFQKRPLSYYKQSRIRDAIVMILDNSGSMDWWSENLKLLASIALGRKDVEVYIAPNGWIEERLLPNGHRHTVFHDDVVKRLKGRRIVYVGDYDGADTPIMLSWFNDVIWICPEERYRRFRSHDWVHYDESYFKGVFIRAWTLQEMFQGLAKVCRFGNLWIDFHTNNKFDDDYD